MIPSLVPSRQTGQVIRDNRINEISYLYIIKNCTNVIKIDLLFFPVPNNYIVLFKPWIIL